jgi:hypothetical protein
MYPMLKKAILECRMSLKCTNAKKACNREGDFKQCTKLYRETCQGTLANHCEVICLRKGTTCPIETARCQKRCLKHINNFKPYSSQSQANLANPPGSFGSIAHQPLYNHRPNSNISYQSQPKCHLSWKPDTGYEFDRLYSMSDCPVAQPYWALRAPYGPSQ